MTEERKVLELAMTEAETRRATTKTSYVSFFFESLSLPDASLFGFLLANRICFQHFSVISSFFFNRAV